MKTPAPPRRPAALPERNVLLGMAVLLAAVLVAACAPIPPVPTQRFYRLMPPPPARVFAQPPLDGPVRVDDPVAEGLLAQTPVLHTAGAQAPRLEQYAYSSWEAPPATLLQRALITYLRDARAAPRVTGAALGGGAAYAIALRLERFEQDLGPRPAALIAVEIAVTDAQGRLLWLKNYAESVPAADDSVTAAAVAMGRATGRLFDRFTADLAAARPLR